MQKLGGFILDCHWSWALEKPRKVLSPGEADARLEHGDPGMVYMISAQEGCSLLSNKEARLRL
jgi:hypothetical protein